MVDRKNWRWYLVIDDKGNIRDGFNSRQGAEEWAERDAKKCPEHHIEVIEVRESGD